MGWSTGPALSRRMIASVLLSRGSDIALRGSHRRCFLCTGGIALESIQKRHVMICQLRSSLSRCSLILITGSILPLDRDRMVASLRRLHTIVVGSLWNVGSLKNASGEK